MATESRRVDDILLEAYKRRLVEFRDPPQELGWPVSGDRPDHFAAMLDVVEETAGSPVVLCDFGCGTGGYSPISKSSAVTTLSMSARTGLHWPWRVRERSSPTPASSKSM